MQRDIIEVTLTAIEILFLLFHCCVSSNQIRAKIIVHCNFHYILHLKINIFEHPSSMKKWPYIRCGGNLTAFYYFSASEIMLDFIGVVVGGCLFSNQSFKICENL
jgi:hypothetical protein